jgi:hypothetical protein
MTAVDWQAEALARNDRYLLECVEKFELCPFARRCRESGALERRVLEQSRVDEAEASRVVRELGDARFAHVEVALLIFPRLSVTSAEMERFAALLRPQTTEFFVVAFHPELSVDATNPDRLVPMLRRSPDPTLQLVRASLLDRVRGPQGDTIFMNVVDIHNPPPLPPPSLSQRIAEHNFETVLKVGVGRMAEILAGMGAR